MLRNVWNILQNLNSSTAGSIIIHTKQVRELFMSDLAELIEAPIEIVLVLSGSHIAVAPE